jgi:protein SCO1
LGWPLPGRLGDSLFARLAKAAVLGIFLTCAGCAPAEQWHLLNVQGHLPDLRFQATSDAGSPIDAKDLRGSTVLVYFGFTQCSEQCPLVMQRLAALVNTPALGAHTRILFVSLDPARDTPQVLHDYLAAFGFPGAVGITASPDAIESLAKRYRIAFYPAGSQGLDRTLPHSTAVYVFDAKGRARLLLQPSDADGDALADIQRVENSADRQS